MKYTEERTQLLEAARQMNERGINDSTFGNVSMRVADGFLVTPSALDYELCQPQDLVLMEFSGTCVSGGRPSTEWRLHRDILIDRPAVASVLHAHAPWCTTLACLGRGIPAFHYLVAVAGGADVRCTPYALFGSQELSDLVVAAIRDRSACLLGNHGLVAVGDSPAAALEMAVDVENLARIYAQTLQIGEPTLLGEDQVAEVLERIADYRRE